MSQEQDERERGRSRSTTIGLEAPERGSADELMDHGAAGELGPMRHSRRARPGRGGAGPVPGHEARDRAGHRRRLLLRLPPAPAADPGRPARDRGADAREHRRRPPVRAQRADRRPTPARSWSSATSRSRSRSSTTSLAAAERDGTPMPPTTFYRQGPFIDLCRGPHVASTGKIGPFKLLGTAGRVLARRREAADAPARLRHGLGDPGGARRVPVAARGGEEARPPPPRRPARPVQLPRRLAGLGLLASQGPAHLAHARDARCASSRTRRGYQEVSTPIVVSRAAVAPVRPLGPLQRQHVHRRVREPAVQPQADELPRESRSSTDRTLRSYRDLPLRFSEYGRLHRNERSGTLSAA